ncbi:hypothetical protein EYR36_000726 [Pleurotus pulmonarius]|nr:hypothetical protein EYR36_000726 [Pleurotus pulmonarius]
MADILQQYAKAREALIAEDRRLRRDSSRESSEVELKADKVVRDIRAAEAVSVWWAEHPDIPHPFPGMEFLTGKSVIVKTEIFKILSKMPKGGLLHAHLDATVDVKCLLSLAYKHPALHIRVPEAVHAASIHTLLPEFKAFPKQEHSEVLELAQSPMQWVQLSKARETFPAELGGAQGFDKWLTASMMINPSEAYGTHNTVAKIWQKFTNTFSVASCLTRYAPIFRDYVREFLLTSIADGISYVEPRINFRHRFMDDVDGNECVPHREWLVMFDEVLKEVKEDMQKQGREDEFIGAKIIYTTLRFITPEELTWYTEDCIVLKKEFPHLIAGFDLVGNENELKPLIDYLEPLLQFQERQKEEGVEIPFLFHAGETFGDGTEADMNMYDAILLGTKRIGHGFSLRLTSSMPTHPLPILFNNGVPVALCCDDPSIFGNMGLTFDFYQVLVSSEVTGLVQLAEVARDSIKYSMLEPEEKQHALESWFLTALNFRPDSSSLPTQVQRRAKGISWLENLCSLLVGKDADSNRKRSRSPSDSEQQKHHKRANTGAPSTSNDSKRNNNSSASHSASDVTMDAPSNVQDTAASTPSNGDKGKDDSKGSDNGKSTSADASAAPTPVPSANIHMRCLIVTQDASIIIGKGGSHVNEIREKSGARVVVSESIPGNPERILNVSGPLDAVSKAFGLIVRRINDEPFDVPSVPGSRAVTIKFMIPNSRMGSVIGKQGSKIKEIQDASGARLNASEGMLPGSTERVLSVAGVADAIHIATYYIGNILIEAQERMPSSSNSTYRPTSNSRRPTHGGSSYVPGYASYPGSTPSNPPQQLQTQQIYIPNDLVGCIIGKGGSKINEIRHMSASQIKIMEPGAVGVGVNGAPAPAGGEGERLVVITGQPANIQMAVQLLYHRLEQEKQKQLRAQSST